MQEIPLIGQGDWSVIDYESIESGLYGITTPDGKVLNYQQVCAVLLMECWYFERKEFFDTSTGRYLLAEIEQKRYEAMLSTDYFLEEWFNSDFTLIGFAGTGKSQSLQAFIHRAKQHAHLIITATAPTNKAVKVLKGFAKSSNITGVEHQTIYQALGMKLETNDDGKEEAKADPDGKMNLPDFDLAILDEASMLNASMYSRIVGLSKRPKFIFMGDSKQLKPVGDKTISPVFTNVTATYTLDKVMRYPEGSAIASLVTAVRDNVGSSEWIDPREYANGEDVIVTDSEDFLDRLIEDLQSDRYQDNPDSVKAICYTNKVVDWINEYCHEKLYGKKADAFVAGERLVSTKPVRRKRAGGMDETILNNRFEVDCLRATEDEVAWDNTDSLSMIDEYLWGHEHLEQKVKGRIVKTPLPDIINTIKHDAVKPFKYWQVRASVVDEDRRVNLNLIDPIERKRYNNTIDALRLIALAMEQRSKQRKFAFFIMYKFIRLVDPVVHSYAITTHSAQGSSYNNVYVAERDLLRCKDLLERSQLKYVAYSRAMEKLIISV